MNTVDHKVEREIIQVGIFQKIFGHFISVIFHPVFVPIYVIWFLLTQHPDAFNGFSLAAKSQTLLISALNLVFFPLLSVVLLKALGFISSIHLTQQRDRIIPLIACGIFYFWTYIVFKEQHQYPALLRIFLLGIFLASSLALIVNIYQKISLHAVGVGGWIGFFIIIALQKSMLMTWPLALSILIAGAVCSARMMVSNHTPKELISGLATGILTQLIAMMFV